MNLKKNFKTLFEPINANFLKIYLLKFIESQENQTSDILICFDLDFLTYYYYSFIYKYILLIIKFLLSDTIHCRSNNFVDIWMLVPQIPRAE